MNQITPFPETPPHLERPAAIVAGLATLYFRHNDPARALALGLMALHGGAAGPQTVLLVASCFLKVGDAEQAEAVLSRLADQALAPQQEAATLFLRAKVSFRTGDPDQARDLLRRAAAKLTPDTDAPA